MSLAYDPVQREAIDSFGVGDWPALTTVAKIQINTRQSTHMKQLWMQISEVRKNANGKESCGITH